MGGRYADPVILNLEATWGESDPRVPLICFLSMGSDPTSQIEGLAKKLHVGKKNDLQFFHSFFQCDTWKEGKIQY